MSNQPSDHAKLRIQWLNPINDSTSNWTCDGSHDVQIGRSSKCEVRIDGEHISRIHAVVSFDGEEFTCNAVGRNGCLCAGEAFTSMTLRHGTTIELGRKGPALRFLLQNDDAQLRGAVTMWAQGVADGTDDEAHGKLWEEYFHQVVRLAKNRLAERFRRMADEEDIALSVFNSFYAGAAKGHFPDLSSRENLWRILAVLTARKVADHVQSERRQKRGGGDVRGESVFISESQRRGLEQFSGVREDAPDFAMQLAEEADGMISMLDESLQPIARLTLDGFSSNEIAEQTGINIRAVQRRLKRVREEWSQRLGGVTDESVD